MKIIKKTYCLLLLLLYSTILQAQDSRWNVNIYDYQYDMSVYAELQCSGSVVTDFANIEVAAFVGDECRAVGVPQHKDGVRWIYFRIRSNTFSGENVTFKLYDKTENKEYFLYSYEEIEFEPNRRLGLPSSPITLTNTILHSVSASSANEIMGSATVEYYVQKAPVNSDVTVTATPATGHAFVGWTKNDQAISTDNPYTFKITEDIHLVAKFKINQYTITFDTDGGSEIVPITQDYNTAITAPSNPTKNGYTFAGWDKEIPETMPAEDITIKALWTFSSMIDDETGYGVLNNGDNYVDIQNPTVYDEWNPDRNSLKHFTVFKYVVKTSGKVTIKAVGNKDTYGVLYDESLNFINFSDDDNGRNFRFVISEAQEGDIYYIGARGYAELFVGPYIINVDNPLPSCTPGNHSMTYVAEVPVTCVHNGIVAYYHCNTCERNFGDTKGTQEIENLIIPALGHKYGCDGKCQHEGCDKAIVVLHDGNNNVDVQNPTTGEEWWNSNILGPDNYTLFLYNVEIDGDIRFATETDAGSIIVMYDPYMNVLYSPTYSYGWYHDYTQHNVKAGDVIVVGVRGYNDYVINSCNINVQSLPICASGQHTMTPIASVSATCTTSGTMEHYHCSKCNFNYADEVGADRIVDIIIPSFGHDYNQEGNCLRDSCGYRAVELNRGDNAVNIPNPTSNVDWKAEPNNPRHYTLFKFTTKAYGDVTIKSFGGNYTYYALYDSCMNLIKRDAGTLENHYTDFKTVIEGTNTGDVYYLGVRGNNGWVLGDYIINVDAAPPSVCAPGQHTMTHVTGVSATCTTEGNIEFYSCDKCERNFTDEEGTNEAGDIVIPALKHSIGDDGKCQHEGCNFSAKILSTGYNYVDIKNPTSGTEWSPNRMDSKHYTMFCYTVKTDGDVIIRSVGGMDTYCALYNSNWKCLATEDGNGNDGFDFKLMIENAKAGDIYYIGARGWGDNVIGEYTIRVSEGAESETITGQLIVGDNWIDFANLSDVTVFNANNTGKMSISQTEIGGEPAVMLTLNDAKISKSPEYYGAITAEISVPLIVNILGEDTISVKNIGEQGQGIGLLVFGDLILAGCGTLNINISDLSDEAIGFGIYANRVISIDDKVADILKEIDGTEIPDEYTFSGTINITGESNYNFGIATEAEIPLLFLSGGSYNIDLNGGAGIGSLGGVTLANSNVKIKAGEEGIGIYLVNGGQENSSTHKNWIDWLKFDYDLFIMGGDLEIDAESSVLYQGSDDQPHLLIESHEEPYVMVVETGDSKDKAQKINTSDLFDVAGSYLHIYEKSPEDNIVTNLDIGINNSTDEEKAFNIMGQCVNKDTKGFVIVNGRTIVRK